jgi:choline dehydrogenase-like flavoprotein
VDVFDYIIVGAGSAGSVVAARLTEDSRRRVLLLEAGPSDWRFWVQLPIGYGKTFYDRRVNWMYQSEPVPGLGGRDNYFPRGKVLGGSSSINAMVYSRGQAGDNAGRTAIETIVNQGKSERDQTVVFGCPLFDPDSECRKPKHATLTR